MNLAHDRAVSCNACVPYQYTTFEHATTRWPNVTCTRSRSIEWSVFAHLRNQRGYGDSPRAHCLVENQTVTWKLRLLCNTYIQEFTQFTVAAVTGGCAFWCVTCNKLSQQLSFVIYKPFDLGQTTKFSEFAGSSASFSPLLVWRALHWQELVCRWTREKQSLQTLTGL